MWLEINKILTLNRHNIWIARNKYRVRENAFFTRESLKKLKPLSDFWLGCKSVIRKETLLFWLVSEQCHWHSQSRRLCQIRLELHHLNLSSQPNCVSVIVPSLVLCRHLHARMCVTFKLHQSGSSWSGRLMGSYSRFPFFRYIVLNFAWFPFSREDYAEGHLCFMFVKHVAC